MNWWLLGTVMVWGFCWWGGWKSSKPACWSVWSRFPLWSPPIALCAFCLGGLSVVMPLQLPRRQVLHASIHCSMCRTSHPSQECSDDEPTWNGTLCCPYEESAEGWVGRVRVRGCWGEETVYRWVHWVGELVQPSLAEIPSFYLFGMFGGTGSIGLSGMISNGLWCDLGKGSRMIRWGEGPRRFAKAGSGFEVGFSPATLEAVWLFGVV